MCPLIAGKRRRIEANDIRLGHGSQQCFRCGPQEGHQDHQDTKTQGQSIRKPTLNLATGVSG